MGNLRAPLRTSSVQAVSQQSLKLHKTSVRPHELYHATLAKDGTEIGSEREVHSRLQFRGEQDEPIPQLSAGEVVPRMMHIRREGVSDCKYGFAPERRGREAADRASAGVHSEVCRE